MSTTRKCVKNYDVLYKPRITIIKKQKKENVIKLKNIL